MGVAIAIGALLSAASAGAAAYAAGMATAWVIAAGIAAGALSLVSSSMMMSSNPNTGQYQSTSTNINARSTSASTGLPILYGGSNKNATDKAFIRTGSVVTWQNVLHDTSNCLFTHHVIGVGDITQPQGQTVINQIYIDNAPVLGLPITQEGRVPQSAILDKFRPYLNLEVRFGKSSYNGTMNLAKSYAGSQWQDSFRGDGLIQIATTIWRTQDSMIDGILTNPNYSLSVELVGRVITDLVTGASDSSSNPPSIIYDYLTNTEFGFGMNPNDIDVDSFKNIAKWCSDNNYYCNGSIDYQKSFKSNIEDILQTFGGVLFEHQGKIYLTIDSADIPVYSFDESNIIGDVSIMSGGRSDYCNCYDAQYCNADHNYDSDIIRFPSDALNDKTIISDGQIIKKDLSVKWLQDKKQLSVLANKELLKHKWILSTISFKTFKSDLKIYDVIDVSFKEAGYKNKKFRIVQIDEPLQVESIGIVGITAIEYRDEIYQGQDPGVFPNNNNIQLPDASHVLSPSNLSIQKLGQSVGGNVVLVKWSASPDPFVRGYRIRYRKNAADQWTMAGDVNAGSTEFTINGLSDGSYDFGVSAYNQLGYCSDLVTLLNQSPQVSFALPAVTGLKVTSTDTATDFSIAWDAQNQIKINGQPIASLLRYYEIKIYHGSTYIKSHYTQDNKFVYTFAQNKEDGLSRTVTFGVIAHGYSTGTYSPEMNCTATNPQCGVLQGVQYKSGLDTFFVEWDQSKCDSDYAGVVVQLATDSNFSQGVQFFSTSNWYSASWQLDDGQYYIRAGAYDSFGQDRLNWCPAISFNQNSKVPKSKLNDDIVNSLMTPSQVNEIVESKISTADNSKWQIRVNHNGNVSGVALGNNGTESVFTVLADRFSIIDPKSANQASKVYPFVVQGGKVWIQNGMIQNGSIGTAQIGDASISNAKIQNASINGVKIQNGSIGTAHIQNGAIDNAKIGNYIQSNNYVPGKSGWSINKNGGAEFSNATFRGHIDANSGTLNNVHISANCQIDGTLNAAHIVGDVAVIEPLSDIHPDYHYAGSRGAYVHRTFNNVPYEMVVFIQCRADAGDVYTGHYADPAYIQFHCGNQVKRYSFGKGSTYMSTTFVLPANSGAVLIGIQLEYSAQLRCGIYNGVITVCKRNGGSFS
ncbi:DUF1983 domain-containing protein [Edwardsiella tarda]|uniref:phage tail tip fiber protein n=1 Tax=Edwardsiella tarda TaxID=636 RepID=UPI0026705D19|nr:DUF1983 domain-containing protein [Edwardsiella tarda]WKS80394.1 DUF1983 domain-containing protein [Edwardsiella tarda]